MDAEERARRLRRVYTLLLSLSEQKEAADGDDLSEEAPSAAQGTPAQKSGAKE